MQYQVAVLLSFALCAAADLYTLSVTIPWAPKTPSSVDQSVIYNNTYYLSDRSNAGVHVVDLTANVQKSVITGFVTGLVNGTLSSSISGPNGLIVLANRNELWVGDGDGTIKVIDLFTDTIVKNITTGSKKRADEFAYDPTSGVVVVTNPSESTPYVTVLNATSRTVIGNITFDGASELEQPAFNPANSMFYVSVPDMPGNEGGAVSAINVAPGNLSVQSTISTPDCINAGIVFGQKNQLFIGCSADQISKFGFSRSYIYDVSTRSRIANVTGVAGVDQVTYSANTGYFYASAYQDQLNGAFDPNLAVIAANGSVLQTIKTDNSTAHSVAVNPRDGSMIVPVKTKGILVYSLGNSSSVNATASATSSGSTAKHTNGAGQVAMNMAAVVGAGIVCAALL